MQSDAMRITRRRPFQSRRSLLAIALAMATASGAALAASTYPDHSIRMEVGFAAGGATDLLARELAKEMTISLKQSVVVENRGGAGGTIATAVVAKAPPDGYTLLYSSAAIASNSAIYKKLPYDPINDFEPITSTFTTTYLLVVNPSVPAKTTQEFIQYAKSKQGALTMATGGPGSSGHLGGVEFAHDAGIDVSYVPYKGTGEKMRDLVSGQVESTIDSITAYVPYFKNGQMRAVCVGGMVRSPLLPEIPTCDASGAKGFDARSWHGVLAPKGTPQPIISLLNQTINAILRKPEVAAEVKPLGSTPLGDTPAEFKTMIEQNIAAFTQAAKLAGLTPE